MIDDKLKAIIESIKNDPAFNKYRAKNKPKMADFSQLSDEELDRAMERFYEERDMERCYGKDWKMMIAFERLKK